MAIKIAGEIEKSFYSSTKLTKKELRDIAKNASLTSASISKAFSGGLKDAQPAFKGIESAGKAAFKAVELAAIVAATAVAGVVAASVAVGVGFEKQMSVVKSLSGATSAEMEDLTDLAKKLGATTQFTATQVGQAMEYMAMAGWKTQDMLNGMAGVLNLAAASGEDLATTSDIVTDAMTAFGLGANQVDHFADVLAATATNSNTTVSMMGESFTYAASLAGALGYSIEDTSVALGLMANSGIKASQAGTALRKIFSETVGGATVSAKAFGKMTIATKNSDGSMRNLKDIIVDLRSAFSKMTESEKAANAESIAGKTGMSGLLAIVNAGEADYNKLTNAIYNCQGAAQKMADTRLDNLSGDVTIMKSALEGLGIQIYDGLNKPLRAAVQWGTKVVGTFSKKLTSSGFIANISTELPTVIRKTEEFTQTLEAFSKPFLAVGGWLVKHPGLIVGTIVGIGTAIETYKIASGIMSMVTALGSLGPVGLGIIAIAGVAAVITGIGTSVKKNAEKLKNANLAEHFGKISLSLEDLNEVANHIVSNNNLSNLRESLDKFDGLKDLQTNINSAVSDLNKMNWKVSIGMQLSDEEKSKYQSDIADYVSDCQQYITDKQYALTMAVNVLTDGSDAGNNIVEGLNSFYQGKQQELADLGTKLNQAVTDAFQDGFLSIDEAKTISSLQAQMADIQAKMADSEFDSKLDLISMKYSGKDLDPETFKNLMTEVNKGVEDAKKDYEKAFMKSDSGLKEELSSGAISQSSYDSQLAELQKGYLKQVSDLEVKANSFGVNTITENYGDEFDKASKKLSKRITDSSQDALIGIYSGVNHVPIAYDGLNSDLASKKGLFGDQATKDAVTEMYQSLQPQQEALQALLTSYEESGEEIPKSVIDGINKASTVGTLSGDKNSLWNMVAAETASNNPEYVEALQNAHDKGWYIPEQFMKGISENQSAVTSSIQGMFGQAKSQINSMFSGGFTVDCPVKLNPSYTTTKTATQGWAALKNPGVAKHANGGIFSKAHLGVVAEAGRTESVIPVDGSDNNAVSLWQQTGQMMGLIGNEGGSETQTQQPISSLYNDMPDTSNESNMKITYKPTLQFYGQAPSKKDLEDAMETSQDKFNRMMDKYLKQNNRLAFSH